MRRLGVLDDLDDEVAGHNEVLKDNPDICVMCYCYVLRTDCIQ